MLRPIFPATLLSGFIVIVFFLLVGIGESSDGRQVTCSKTCVAENCNTIWIRYGKYCGVGWSGCPGEKPCDDLDACCQIHDDCVGQKGMNNVKCHEKFKRCIKKVHKSGKPGFSRECPYDIAVPTMQQVTVQRQSSGEMDMRVGTPSQSYCTPSLLHCKSKSSPRCNRQSSNSN